MEDLLNAFGIDVKLIVVQILNFVVLATLLTYFLYKPVLKILSEREEKIAQGVRDAEEAANVRAAADETRKEVLTAAHKEAEEISARAESHAGEKASEIVAAAETKAASLVQNAEAKGEHIKSKAQSESEAEIARLAVLAAEKVLRERS